MDDAEKLNAFLTFFSLSPCVSFVKYALGLRTWTQTPYGLYKLLMKLHLNKKMIKNVDVTTHLPIKLLKEARIS